MTVAIIPARGGSTRIAQKNRRPFHGKPVIAYSIETAQASKLFEEIVVATDDKVTARIAKAMGCTIFETSGWIAGPHCGTQEVVQAVRWALNFESEDAPEEFIACCLYATAPLLLPQDLRRGYDAMLDARDSAGTKMEGVFAMGVGAEPLRDAGQFYFGLMKDFGNEPLISERTRLIVLPEHRICDINTEDDWQRAERMYEELHK